VFRGRIMFGALCYHYCLLLLLLLLLLFTVIVAFHQTRLPPTRRIFYARVILDQKRTPRRGRFRILNAKCSSLPYGRKGLRTTGGRTGADKVNVLLRPQNITSGQTDATVHTIYYITRTRTYIHIQGAAREHRTFFGDKHR